MKTNMKRNMNKNIKSNMKKILSSVLASFLVVASTVSFFNTEAGNVQAAGVPVREGVETTPASGNIIVGVEGTNYTSDLQSILNEINKVRKEACDAGNVPDPRDTSRMLTPSDYVPLKIGKNCQKAAEVRAAEASFNLEHTRPNGKKSSSAFRTLYSGTTYVGENLAWGSKKCTRMEGWIDEKDEWISTGGTWNNSTGHYANLINPNYNYMGVSTFNPANDNLKYDWDCTAGCYSKLDEPLTSLPGAQNTTYIQKIEVPVSKIVKKSISGSDRVILGKTESFGLTVDIAFNAKYDVTVTDCPVYGTTTWTSSNPGILTIDANGVATGKKEGSATITAASGGISASRNMNVTVYKNEWVEGKWYDASGNQTYAGTLQWKKNASGYWVEDTAGWYPTNQWQRIDGKWYYFTASGYMDYSEYRDGCWLNSDGSWNEKYSHGKWNYDGYGWWYQDDGWYPRNQNLWIDGVRYYFDGSGYMR